MVVCDLITTVAGAAATTCGVPLMLAMLMAATTTGHFPNFLQISGRKLRQRFANRIGIGGKKPNPLLLQAVEHAATDATGKNERIDIGWNGTANACRGIDH